MVVHENPVGGAEGLVAKEPTRHIFERLDLDARGLRHLREAEVRAVGEQGGEKHDVQVVDARRVRVERR